MSQFIINAFADESDGKLAGQIDALKRNRLSGLEIRGVDGKNIADTSLEKVKDISAQLADNGLNVWSVGSRLGKIKITDDFAPHLEEFKRTLEFASVLGAGYIRLFSFYIPKSDDPGIYADEVMERLSRFIESANGSNIKLCHENEKGIYGDIASRCLEIHTKLPQLGCIFDPANYIQCGQDTLEAWDMLGHYVTYMHIKDALPNGSVVPAGKGAGNIKILIEKYKANGGKGLTIEPHLTVFSGLSELERDGDKSLVGEYRYSSKEAAFDVAVSALRELI